uniref:A-kinase anchoring protein 11 n=1 Tax=Nothoprocta perdicaria TaxID=30464 RepID=A0A8C6ZBV9_NOTPE
MKLPPTAVCQAIMPMLDSRKEYTVQQALFCTSGVVSSIPVPLAGRALCQNQMSSDVYRAKTQATSNSDDSMKVYKDSTHPLCTTRRKEEEIASFRNIYLTSDPNQSTEENPPLLHNQNDTKQVNDRSGMNNNLELTSGPKSISSFSGTMVDMIVNEAYEAITSSRVTKAVGEYKGLLTRKVVEKKPYLQCIGEDFPKNMFADHLAKYIIKQSVDESSSVVPTTSDYLVYNLGSQTHMPLNNPSKSLLIPAHSVQCSSESKDSWQEQRGRRFLSSSPPRCSSVAFSKQVLEDFTDTGSCSVKYLNKPSKKPDTQISSGSVTCRQDDSLQMEDKSAIKDGSTSAMPGTPPPTPLVPCQASSEKNLRKLSKKLKGELAKEFAPATPPSTPYNPSVSGLSETEIDPLEKEEFMLKLMRSLSEEVESSEDEDCSEMPVEKEEHPAKTVQYADHLASHIISMATEMAASQLDDKTNEGEANKKANMPNKRSGSAAFVDIPEETCNSLWNYAGDMAGKVINEAKKMVKSRNCKLLRLKRVNCQLDCLHLRRGDKGDSSRERWAPGQEHWSGERDSSVFPLPQTLGMMGLTSKYPSCESVTEEYADHIIRVLRREGGNAELLVDQYASRLVYRSIKSGLQQAARKTKLRYSRKILPGQNAEVNGRLELFKIMNKDPLQQAKSCARACEEHTCRRGGRAQSAERTELLHFSESLAQSITWDVRRKLRMSGTCLPKSLTDSCLYKKTELDEIPGDLVKTTLSRTFLPFSPKQKLYHSTGSLNENGYSEGIIQAIEQYARKVADDTLEMSLESAVLRAAEHRKNGDRLSYTEQLSPFSGSVCRCCSMKEHQYCAENASHLPAQEPSHAARHFPPSRVGGVCQKSKMFPLDIPKIHIDVEQKAVLSDKVVAAAVEKAERELSTTSLAADSGIGHDGVSFAESLTTEIMTAAMTNIGQADNVSSTGREGFHSVESIVSQQMNLSIGDDSTGSWSNLSFEDEHPDESSSFLHLSDSNGNSSSWSSLGLEGDLYEENLSFPTSDRLQARWTLAIMNVDLEPNIVDPQLRAALQCINICFYFCHFSFSFPEDCEKEIGKWEISCRQC